MFYVPRKHSWIVKINIYNNSTLYFTTTQSFVSANFTVILLQARRYSADEIDYDEYADTVNQINNSKNCSSNHFPTG